MNVSIEKTLQRLEALIVNKMADYVNCGKKLGADTQLFAGGLELDSVATAELIAVTEELFGIEFHQEDLAPENFRTLFTLATTITSRLIRQRGELPEDNSETG